MYIYNRTTGVFHSNFFDEIITDICQENHTCLKRSLSNFQWRIERVNCKVQKVWYIKTHQNMLNRIFLMILCCNLDHFAEYCQNDSKEFGVIIRHVIWRVIKIVQKIPTVSSASDKNQMSFHFSLDPYQECINVIACWRDIDPLCLHLINT